MATEKPESKANEAKVAESTAKESKAKESMTKKSIGFLRASERANIAASEIPLNFLSDLGIMTDQIDSYKKLNRKFINGMYARVYAVAEAPGKFMDSLAAKMSPAKKATPTPVVKPKPEPKKASSKAKPNAAVKAKPKAKAAPKPKAAAKPKVPAKPKETVKAVSKPKANPTAQPIGAMKTPGPSGGIH